MNPFELRQLLELAVAHHRANRLGEAEALYRQVLAADPRHAPALDLLGVLLAQSGRAQEGIASLRTALQLEPRLLSAWQNLGRVYRMRGETTEALACYRQVIALDPSSAHGHNQVGELIVASDPEGALRCFERAASLDPANAKALLNLGNRLAEKGRFEPAVDCFRRVVQLRPDVLDGYINLGNALAGLRQFEEAIACYDHVLRQKPDTAAAVLNRGHAIKGLSRHKEALLAYERALALEPARTDVLVQMGECLLELERFQESIDVYLRALAARPDHLETRLALVNAYRIGGRLDAAIEEADRAVAAVPRDTRPRQCRAALYMAAGRIKEAIAEAQAAAAIEPENAALAGAVAAILHYDPDATHAAVCAAANDWGRRFADPLLPSGRSFSNERSPGRKLRIGYVSPDFHGHPVGFNVLPLVREHDRQAFEVICYAQESHPDAVTAEFQRFAEGWRDTVGKSDEELAAMVRNDGIDILVDLALHTGGNRLLTFARKPAPVQVTFAGYPGTTGVKAIDYRLTDPWLDPPPPLGDDSGYAEKSWRLPDTFWCYDPLAHAFPVNELPATSAGHVMFGCLNNFCKINEQVIALWAAVLRATPDSRLMLLTGEGAHRNRTRAAFESHGVAGERIVFEMFRPRIKYLDLYRQIDIGLDTIPYNGHTTSLDCYWMGVPVVTLVGRTVVGRAGLSQLSNLRMPELVGRSPEEFVQIANSLAFDFGRLAEIRRTLRERMRASPLIDGKRFARSVESAFRAMWRTWCQS